MSSKIWYKKGVGSKNYFCLSRSFSRLMNFSTDLICNSVKPIWTCVTNLGHRSRWNFGKINFMYRNANEFTETMLVMSLIGWKDVLKGRRYGRHCFFIRLISSNFRIFVNSYRFLISNSKCRTQSAQIKKTWSTILPCSSFELSQTVSSIAIWNPRLWFFLYHSINFDWCVWVYCDCKMQ